MIEPQLWEIYLDPKEIRQLPTVGSLLARVHSRVDEARQALPPPEHGYERLSSLPDLMDGHHVEEGGMVFQVTWVQRRIPPVQLKENHATRLWKSQRRWAAY